MTGTLFFLKSFVFYSFGTRKLFEILHPFSMSREDVPLTFSTFLFPPGDPMDPVVIGKNNVRDCFIWTVTTSLSLVFLFLFGGNLHTIFMISLFVVAVGLSYFYGPEPLLVATNDVKSKLVTVFLLFLILFWIFAPCGSFP